MDFGCEFNDVACYCADERFLRGLSDCGTEACGDASEVVAFGTAYCQCELHGRLSGVVRMSLLMILIAAPSGGSS